MKRNIFIQLGSVLVLIIGTAMFLLSDNSYIASNIKSSKVHSEISKTISVKERKNNSLQDKKSINVDSLKNSSWFSIITGKIKAEEYEMVYNAGEKNYSSPNPKQNLMFTYYKNGFSVEPLVQNASLLDSKKTSKQINNWNIGIFLKEYGRENMAIPFAGSKFNANKNSGTVSDGNLEIEYNNTQKGMRQDFILNRKTVGKGNLFLSLKIKTKLQFSVNENSIKFSDSSNKIKMNYSDLKIYDNSGKSVKGKFIKLNENTVQICVSDNNAEYPLRVDPLSTTPDWTQTGAANDELFGFSLAAAGDVNKDGYGDVIISTDNHSSTKGTLGKVYVYYGSFSGLPTNPNWVKSGENSNDQFGWSVSTAGDVNGDGYSDIIVSAVNYGSAAGKVYVFYGGPSGLDSTAAWTQTGESSGDEFGYSLSNAGDVNGDGISDIVVGAHYHSSNIGKVYVYYGSKSVGLPSSASWTQDGENQNDFFGNRVSTVGDVKHNGYSGIIVSAIGYSDSTGKVYVYYGSSSGLPPSASWTQAGENAHDKFGLEIASAGDVNNDGNNDVIISAPQYSSYRGKIYVYYGSSSGLSGASWTLSGNNPNDFFGSSIASAGDVNRDGFDDIIVGAKGVNNNTGKAYIYYGGSLGLSFTPAWSADGESSSDLFGSVVASIGDINGDGCSDIIVRAEYHPFRIGKVYVYYGVPSTAIVATNSASNITQTTATLNGTVNPNGSSTTVQFEYGTSNSYGNTATASQSPLNGSNNVNVSADINGLSPNTLYHFRIKATNNSGTSHSADSTFMTLPDKPTVTTSSASNITQTTATLNGIVNPNGTSAAVEFEYGTTNSYGNTVTASPGSVNGSSSTSVSANISVLSPNTLYHYRIKATNSTGTAFGSDSTFITLPNKPAVTTSSASNIVQTAATLNGIVNPNGAITTVKFDYGTSNSYGSTANAIQGTISGSSNINVSTNISGLSPNTLYHYRVEATNSAGTSFSADSTFITPILNVNQATVTTYSASGITQTSATLNGEVNPKGTSATVKFEYGTSNSYGDSVTASQSPVNGSNNVSVSADINGLLPNTLYNFRVKATNGSGTSYGADSTFMTLPDTATVKTASVSNIVPTAATLNGVINPKGAEAIVEFEYGVTKSYGTKVTAVQSPVNGSSNVNVFANISGLLPNTLYHYRVEATNKAGTVYGNDSTFTTPVQGRQAIVKTNSASNIGQSTATLNGTVNPNGLSAKVEFEYGISNGYGNNITAAQSIIDSSDVSANISGLSPNTLYHYRIKATNDSGVAYGADSTFNTKSTIQPIALTGSVSNLTANSATLNGKVNPNGLSTTVQFDYGITTDYGNTIAAAQSPVNGNTDINVSAVLTGLSENTTYHYRVKATNSNGTTLGSDIVFKTSYTYPATLNLTQSYSFSDYTKNTSYKLIGLPGNLNSPLISILGDTTGQHWDAYYDNGNTNNYLVHFDNTSVFFFKPGNGFWVIGDKALNISQNVQTVSLTSGYYAIQLHNGWNIISNPYVKSVVWDSVISLNSLSNDTLWGWNAGWYTSSTLLPFQAYYFYNIKSLSTLKIPYDPNGTLTKKINKLSSKTVVTKGSSLIISLNQGSSEKAYVIISIDSASSNDYDLNDVLTPPGDFEDVGMNLYNNNLSISYKNLIKESRPMTGDGQAFDINIKNTYKENLTLKIEGVDKFGGSDVYLMDEYDQKLLNIKEDNNISLPAVKNSNYQILIGNNDFIKAKEKEITPKQFMLFQNYPNPFNPVTKIRFSLPEVSKVTMKIYNILGQEVRTLLEDQLYGTGSYDVEFDGRNLASGVYIVRMEASNYIKEKKMILLK